MYDTIIIGAGMSGLAAGIRLAHFEQRVCILEKHYTIGGLNSFYRLRRRDYDVGLHAVTNYTPKGTRKGPLAQLLKQLRIPWDDFDLSQQAGSAVRFPGVELNFNNDPALLESEIARAFPAQKDNFAALRARIVDYSELTQELYDLSARAVLGELISDPLLIEMLLCPLMWYGNAREQDMDWGQFCIMFRSIFLEGFSRPYEGVRRILKILVRKFRDNGGELRLRSGVARIEHDGQRATAVVLEDGEVLHAKNIVSSAGVAETMKFIAPLGATACSQDANLLPQHQPGKLSFVEAISILDCPPRELGHDKTIVFYNDSEQFHWRKPAEPCDLRTGVICTPNNYLYEDEAGQPRQLADQAMRITVQANYDYWTSLSEEDYAWQKEDWYAGSLASAVRFVPDFRPRVIDHDAFTPRTIERFTSHINGAVYGAPQKRLDGGTTLENLYLCGSDQGYVGIVGTLLSGIEVANRRLLH